MKKANKIGALLLCSLLAVSSFACGGKKEGDYSKTEIEGKTSIYVHVTNGGYGYSWLEEAAYEWDHEEANEDYHIIVVPSTEESAAVVAEEYKGGNAQHIYFFSHTGYANLVENGYVEDLSDVLSVKPDGTKNVEELLRYPDTVKNSFSFGQTGKLYGLPYGDSALGLVFDYKMFEDNGWLIMAKADESTKAALDEQQISYEEVGGALYYTEDSLNYAAGDAIAACGKDGKYGTYDDGQPVTMAEWESMIGRIKGTANAYPIIYTTKYNNYLTSVFPALLAQYQGLEAYNAFIQYNGNYTDENGNAVSIPLNEGYRVYDMNGFKKAVEFMKTYYLTESNVHPKSWGTIEFSHRDAQNSFLLGYSMTATQAAGAMLSDGIWWENEARPMFNSLADRGETERAYGKRDYRQMFYPNFDGQVGGNGDGTGSVIAAHDAGAVFVMKNQNAELVAKCKDFVAYTLKEKHLKNFTVKSGAIRPYNYSIEGEELAALTPYQRNVWQWYNDRENVTVVRPGVEEMTSPVVRFTTHENRYSALLDSKVNISLYNSLLNNTATAYIEGAKKYNSHNWETWMGQVPSNV